MKGFFRDLVWARGVISAIRMDLHLLFCFILRQTDFKVSFYVGGSFKIVKMLKCSTKRVFCHYQINSWGVKGFYLNP